ncbi:S8 family serine peptidase [Actinomadura sp. CNU-125]|uniref:S8 family serine peptidase n=1 Tax=Actinomadura sp. CNU-125 TaxID=1904961 RepID=UPI0009F9A7A6
MIAARSEGTAIGTPLDANYTKLSGTSMAAPHVAGGAALLAAAHPDWKPSRLKAALVGTADPATGGDPYELGAGRLDVGEAARTPVLADQGVVDLGTSAYPGHGELSTKLGWTSSSGKAARLTLDVEVTDRDGRTTDGAATVPSHVDVPANGTATAPLTIDASRLDPGLHTAVVTAKGGGATVQTVATLYVEPPTHTLTIDATPLPGADPANLYAWATVVNTTDVVELATTVEVADGATKIRVPEGRYSILGTVQGGGTGDAWYYAVAGDPDVLVDGDTTVTLDGAKAVPATVQVEGVQTKAISNYANVVQSTDQGMWSMTTTSGDAEAAPMMLQPMDAPQTGSLRAYAAHRLRGPDGFYDVLRPLGDGIPADPSHVITAAEHAKLARVDARFAAFDGDATEVLADKRYGLTPEGLLLFDAYADGTPAGTTRTDHVSTGDGIRWTAWGSPRDIPGGWVDQSTVTEFRPGQHVEHTWGRQPLRPGPYSGTGFSSSTCVPAPTTRTRGNLHVALVDLQTRPDGFDCGVEGITGKLALSADGKKVGETDGPVGDFTVPSGDTEYKLTYENDSSAILPVSTRTSTSWTFDSRAPRGDESTGVPLLLVDYDLNLDLTNRPTDEPAVFTASRMAGTGDTKVTGLRFWTSTDDGATWTEAETKPLGNGKFSAPLPSKGSVSLRVSAEDEGGSAIDQTIIRAYNVN